MNIYLKFSLFLAGLIIVLAIIVGTAVFLSLRGPDTKVPVVSSTPETLGSGKPLVFVVLGDSTSAGQGGDYAVGIARSSAQYLAKSNQVTFYNFSVSGAKINDVLTKQSLEAKDVRPDIVLVAVGANDATGLTSLKKVSSGFDELIKNLISQNCNVKIILTGSPDTGTIPRLVEPLRSFAGWRSRGVNKTIDKVAAKYRIIRAPILEKTGPLFEADRSLFAIDRYHPNDKGYQTWVPVLTDSIASALKNQPSHCN